MSHEQQLDELMLEIERQISIASNSSQQTRVGSNKTIEELVIDDQDKRYYLDLKDWLSQNETKLEDVVIPSKFQKCLWKLLALSNSSSPIINPKHQQTECRDIQRILRRDCPNSSDTEDIWQAANFLSWASSAEPSIVIIQGSSQTINCLRQFSYEISSQLEEMYPSVWMLSEPYTCEFFAERDETELLRQLAVQALRKVPHFKASFLVKILRLFKNCATSYDWFQILKNILQNLPEVYVVVDLNILGNRINNAKDWPHDFQALISQLSSGCSSKLAVILLSSQPLPIRDPNTLVVSVALQLPYPKRPPQTHPNDAIKCLSAIMSTDEKGDGHAECSSILALGVEGATHDPILRTLTRAKYNTPRNASALEASRSDQQENNKGAESIPNSILKGTIPSTPPHRNKIAIAIICALPLEANAVCSVFDHHWDMRLFGNLGQDKNTYSVGRIGCHDVVLIHMPGIGKVLAATVAVSCRISFPGISLALVVGICGAVPFYRHSTEVLLGDVIISDSLVHSDFGRQFPDIFIRKNEISNSARKQPQEVRSFLSKMKMRSSQDTLHSRTGFHLGNLLQSGDLWYPEVTDDRLFEPSYLHKHRSPSSCAQCASSEHPNGLVCDAARKSTCETLKCDLTKLVTRQRHSQIACGVRNRLPWIHFGAYASGDTIMKSGEHRDQTADKEDVIAFEMEGAGVWEIFPCILIKGVSDYADSHKNKKWQNYAAAAAAACLKALLEGWSTRNMAFNS